MALKIQDTTALDVRVIRN